jgi:hypothetical protein
MAMFMRARVGRGQGSCQWEAYRSLEGDGQSIAVFVHCPFCDLLMSLGSAPVRPDGQVSQPIVCSSCQVTYELVLVGWCFGDVHRPSVYAGPVAQADGCGS